MINKMCTLSQNSRYRILCKLYKQYKSAIRIIKHYDTTTCTLCIKVNEINTIMQELEKFPISWEFYNKQNFKFSQDFENLIIFNYC